MNQRVRRFIGDVGQSFAFAMVTSIVVLLAAGTLAMLSADGNVRRFPGWYEQFSYIYLYVPFTLWVGGFLFVRLMRRNGKEIKTFRITRGF